MDPLSIADASKYIPLEIAWRYRVIPQVFRNDTLILLVDQHLVSETAKNELEIITGYEVQFVDQTSDFIENELRKRYRSSQSGINKYTLTNANDDNFLQKIIIDARELGSSDIHIEAFDTRCRIRFRVDGKLLERYQIPKESYASFINKIKIKAKLDIAEKRLPQDGRMLYENEQLRIDIRVSVLPTLYSEKIVLRLLGNDTSQISLDLLGLEKKQLKDLTSVLKKPNGIILISGPTGSGKTTTLYATLKFLNKEDRNILTIEDPIEYTLNGINQVQLRENIGLSFASALRTFLRQDPDIIMLGEIRDGETAEMAIRAALTGHLVLSTIHTNSAWGIVARLIDMGVPPFLIANTLNMAIAQRLIRKLCPVCKKVSEISEYGNAVELPEELVKRGWHIPVGCDSCFFTGYSGRMAIYECIVIDNDLVSAIRNNTPEISEYIKQNHIGTLRERALELLSSGVTSIEEVYPILINQ